MARSDKKDTYEILLTSTRVHKVAVKGASPDAACRLLQRKIAGKPIRDTNILSISFDEVWSNPLEKGEAWLVKVPGQSGKFPDALIAWNGKSGTSCNMSNLWNKYFKDEHDGD